MRDFPQVPGFNKHDHVQGCMRLPVRPDGERMRAEVASLPESVWGTTAGRIGVHRAAQAVFLRGFAPAEGDKPIEDRPILDDLPSFRLFLEQTIPAPPLRALLARLPAGATIPPHVDKGPYFANSIRIHAPIETNEDVWMFSDGCAYQMRVGEVWALNNIAMHGVWNRHHSLARTHLICDFLPTEPLLDLLARSERGLGQPITPADQTGDRRMAG